MENRFKLRISRMFRSSFGSCRSRNISDVIEKPVFVSQNRQNFHTIEPFSPKPRPFPSMCRPKCPQTNKPLKNNSTVSKIDAFPRQKVYERCSLFVSADMRGLMCPPASPILPLNTYHKFNEFEPKEKGKEKEKISKKKKKMRVKSKKRETFLFSSSSGEVNCSGSGTGYLFSSEDETETLFSSKSLSSNSSESHRRASRPRRKNDGTRRRRSGSTSSEVGLLPLQGKVKDSFAVVKRSSDPHNDFRTSMVEMIVEKQIFAANDLEQLLQCFLSLNSHHHHRVIIEVFTEIWEALFSNWS
ncbi:hypothetical protein L1049_001377 [Liquidambar formosana]|uniref:Transcription repressor n=1 Tax=Liquidambar formosana TaxID=63359 RepID=A0AAP0ND71_LIQFO